MNFLIKLCYLYVVLFTSLFAADYRSFVLDNGLVVYVIKTNSPIITHAIAYGVGSIEEKSGKEGVAHFLEHSMFFGTNRYSKKDVSAIVKETGAYYNAFTSYDMTLYYFNFPARHLKRIIQFESDRMKWLVLNDKDVENEKQVINQENKMYQNNVYSVFYDTLRKYTYSTTNYGRSVIGWEKYFNKLTRVDIKNFYDTWYAPNNAKVFIIGNVDFKEVRKVVETYYGVIPSSRKTFEHTKNIEEPYNSDITVEFKDTRVNQNIIVKSFLVPSLISDTSVDKKDSHSLIILEDLLSSKFGEIYNDMVVEKKLLVNFYVSYDEYQKGSSTFSFTLIPKEGITRKEVLTEFDKILQDTLTKGFTKLDLRLSVNRIKDTMELLREDEMQYIFRVARYVNAGLTFKETQRLISSLGNIKSVDVKNSYNKYIKNAHYVLGVAIGE